MIAAIIPAVVRVGIIDIAADMRGIMPAAVVVGIIIVDMTWTYRQRYPWGAATAFDVNLNILGALAGLANGISAWLGIGH